MIQPIDSPARYAKPACDACPLPARLQVVGGGAHVITLECPKCWRWWRLATDATGGWELQEQDARWPR